MACTPIWGMPLYSCLPLCDADAWLLHHLLDAGQLNPCCVSLARCRSTQPLLYITCFMQVNSIPAVIDAGTNNEPLRSHELYQGERAPRLPEPELLEAVEELCAAVAEVAPHCLVQFEDFETDSVGTCGCWVV